MKSEKLTRLEESLMKIAPDKKFVLAFSGGVDSSILLCAAKRMDMDVFAVFEPIRDKKLIESYGMYRDPEEDMPEDIFEVFFKPVPTMRIKEYCTEKYSIRDMKLVQVGKIMSARLRKIEWVTVESGRQARR